ncbi:MAG: HAMP domain-containing histidine kinase [Saprospiraceae bacterium]|nr:HAMP domain-containing histidine kinase [Saprospiraceae bacterium]
MKINHIAWLIAAAALAILALIAFQVSWMRHSRSLIEEQFNNRVNMALCSTVEKIAADPACSNDLRACCAPANASGCRATFDEVLQKPEMGALLTEALHFYQIDLPYRVLISPKDSGTAASRTPFSCSLNPVLEDDTHLLQLEFQGRSEYYLHRMGAMIGASVGILLFICLIFALAAYYLLRQKRLSDRTVDFFNHMTHEFRTPLTNMRLASNLMARKDPTLADNKYLHIIRRECSQLTHQVENVLHLSNLEKGDYQLHKETIDLQALVQEVVQSMDLQIQDKAAQVDIQVGAGPCIVQGDAFHLGNAFRNILDNALKYSPQQPQVNISIEARPAGCTISFEDNGIGIPARERRKIFRKFHRCEAAVSSGEKGFGLGLAYVRKIVELHRGQVQISNSKQPGTRFDLFFPA